MKRDGQSFRQDGEGNERNLSDIRVCAAAKAVAGGPGMRVAYDPAHIVRRLGEARGTRDLTIGGKSFASLVNESARISIVGSGKLTERTLVAHTPSARGLLESPAGRQAIEGWLEVMESRGAEGIYGLGLAHDHDTQVAGRLLTNLEAGYGRQMSVSQAKAAVNFIEADVCEDGLYELDGWIEIGPRFSRAMDKIAAGSAPTRADIHENSRLATFLRHEGEHALAVSRFSDDDEIWRLEEAVTHLLATWEGEPERTARAMGLEYLAPGGEYSIATDYDDWVVNLRRILYFAGVESFDGAHEMLRSGPLESVSAKIATAIADRRGLSAEDEHRLAESILPIVLGKAELADYLSPRGGLLERDYELTREPILQLEKTANAYW